MQVSSFSLLSSSISHDLHAEQAHERAVHWNTFTRNIVPFGHFMSMGILSHVSTAASQHLQFDSNGL